MAGFNKKSVKRRITTAFELPKDIILDLPSIYLIGDEELVISNHKGILGYVRELVSIKTSIGHVKISGQKLALKEVSRENIIVTGKIENIAIAAPLLRA